MDLCVYRTAGRVSRSILFAEHVTEIELPEYPEDPQVVADEFDGDILEITPSDLEEEEDQ